jgi:SHS2 domain-containing protein
MEGDDDVTTTATPTLATAAAGDRDDGVSPLDQRTTGRRSQRRQRRQQLSSQRLQGNDFTSTAAAAPASSSDSEEEGDSQRREEEENEAPSHFYSSYHQYPRRPPVAVEDRIDATLAARMAQSTVRGSAAMDKNSPETLTSSTNNATNSAEKVFGLYEYLDHTADVQLHAWGCSLPEAMQHLSTAMFGYMTELQLVHEERHVDLCNADDSNEPIVGHDVESLVFNYLTELLGLFHASKFVVRRVEIIHLERPPTATNATASTSSSKNEEEGVWKIPSCICYGENLSVPSKHRPGTEIKAITYSHLQIVERDDRCDIWVIVDI